jgi:DNA-directed RNA polymerase subunit RPC12/RpoP
MAFNEAWYFLKYDRTTSTGKPYEMLYNCSRCKQQFYEMEGMTQEQATNACPHCRSEMQSPQFDGEW